MKMIRSLLLGLGFLALSVLGSMPANAQFVVASCGTLPAVWSAGQNGRPFIYDINGNLCVNASVTASVTGFHTESSLTPITATTGGVSSASFTAGKSVLASNTGATNTAFCAPGASATLSSTPILPGQTVEITTTAETAITCITSTSTTTVSFQVGTGLATGWGGSGSGGGGGATWPRDEAAFTWGTTAYVPAGGVYQTTATNNPLTNGQAGAWQFTANRAGFVNLRNASGTEIGTPTTPLADNVTQWASSALGAMANYGTPPGAVLVPGVNAFVTNIPAVTQSGAWNVTDISGTVSLPTGAATSALQTTMNTSIGTINTTLLTFQGPKNAGAAAANSLLAGSVYNSTPLTVTNGQQASLQGDANGYLKVNVAAGGAGGGAATLASGSVLSGAYASGSISTGAFVDFGAIGNTVCATDNGAACSLMSLVMRNNANLTTLNATAGAGIPTQAPTVSIGGVGIIDSAGTNVATVKAASTIPAATDKTLVVGLNPGTSVAGTPTGAIVTVQGVGSMTPFAVSRDTTANGATHGLYSNLLQGDTVLSATNGSFANILQGNAALSATNGLYANLMVGNAAVATGTGAQGSTVPRLTVATDTATIAGSAPGTVGSPSANIVSVQTPAGDPCQTQAQLDIPFSVATATTQNILTGTSAKKIYVCYLYMQTGLANNVAVISGTTGGTCGANTAALVGGTTAATGLINAANSGQAFGNGGSSVFHVKTNNDDICIIASAAGPLAGVIKYVVQ